MSGLADTSTLSVIERAGASFAELPDLRLQLRSPGGSRVEVSLGLHSVAVGTDPSCDLQSADPTLSRRHCEVRRTDEGVELRDLGSKNGTKVHGVRIVTAYLPPGAVVRLGNSELTLVAGPGSEQVELATSARFGDAVGASLPMRALFKQLERVAPTDLSVLLLGETGSGKGVLARAVHDASRRAEGPFVVVDCGSLPPTLIESELFGHERGAFTGAVTARAGLLEEAHGGTLFLDEIGELPLELQTRLLRVLETKQVRPVGSNEWRPADVRVLSATHRQLIGQAATFRPDLYYRLAAVEVVVPPLRDRKDDLPALVERFLAEQEPPAMLADLPPRTLELFRTYSWPGNVRELRNAVLRLRVFPDLGAEVLGTSISGPRAAKASSEGAAHLPWRDARERAIAQFERSYLAAKLKAEGGVVAAAKAMGVSRQFLHRLMVRYDLRGDDE